MNTNDITRPLDFAADHPVVNGCQHFFASHAVAEGHNLRYATASELRRAASWQTACGKAARRILSQIPADGYARGSANAFAPSGNVAASIHPEALTRSGNRGFGPNSLAYDDI